MQCNRPILTMLCLIFCSLPLLANSAETINLAVANSTCMAIKQVGDDYTKRTGTAINYICKSSGRLAKGLNGNTIKADIYISANRKWMDYMLEHGLIDEKNITSPWGNELVVAAPASSPLTLKEWEALTGEDVQTILIGDPGTAPFGRYAKEALKNTSLWNNVRVKIITKKHITLLADTLAESDANTVGILFMSNITDKHKLLLRVDSAWHSPIRYFMGPLGNATDRPEVAGLVNFIQESASIEVFRLAGFKVNLD
jgi:molybdate transport system substrate-binding protein